MSQYIMNILQQLKSFEIFNLFINQQEHRITFFFFFFFIAL